MLVDTKQMKKQAWHEVAQQQGLSKPSDDQLGFILDMRLERAITEVLLMLAVSEAGCDSALLAHSNTFTAETHESRRFAA